MKNLNWKSGVVGLALATLALAPSHALAVPTGLELLLLVDTSGSINSTEYDLQKQGYVNAFNNATIHSNIASITGGVAVAYAEWSGVAQQSLLVDWMLLTDATTSSAFATAINDTSRAFNGSGNLTAPGSAINWGNPLFDNNGYEGTRLVIDVSGDGKQNDGNNTAAAAAAALTDGITVNGLAILGQSNLEAWYQDNIVTPGGGFLETAASFQDFEDAVTTKIGREISEVPEPGTVILFGTGLAGLAAWRMRKGKQAA